MTNNESNDWILIVIFATITVVIVGLIVGLIIFVSRNRYENQPNRYLSRVGSTESTKSSTITENEAKTKLSDISVLNDRPNELRIRSESKNIDKKRDRTGNEISNSSDINTKNQKNEQMKSEKVRKEKQFIEKKK